MGTTGLEKITEISFVIFLSYRSRSWYKKRAVVKTERKQKNPHVYTADINLHLKAKKASGFN